MRGLGMAGLGFGRQIAGTDLSLQRRQIPGPAGRVAVHEEVHRQRRLQAVHPAGLEQPAHHAIDRLHGRADRHRRRLRPPLGPMQAEGCLQQGLAGTGIGAVGQCKQAHASPRHQDHERAIAGVAAAMDQHLTQLAVAHCHQAHGIGRGLGAAAGPAAARPHAAQVQEVGALSHLAHRRAAHRPGLGAITCGPGVEQEGQPAGVVLRAGLQTAHRAKGARAHRGFQPPLAVFPAVAERAAGRRRLLDVEARVLHTQRRQQPLLDAAGVGLAAGVVDDAAQQRVAEVGVLHRRLRRPGEGQALAQQGREVGIGQRCLPIAPGVVGDEARSVVQQVAHADAWRVAGRVAPAAQLGHIGLGQRVELQLAIVAQRQHAQGREGLGHRRDAEQGLRRDRPARVEVLHAQGLQVHELAFGDDAPDKARHMLVQGPGVERSIQTAEHVVRRLGCLGLRCVERHRRHQP
mmetsp:Transcript_9628/g.22423  ORF Transcript_9628/g.22423 Transcript_9628/m.22423 type:complete len:461 (-) Transcript_9628:2399-3781(-)